MSRWIMLVASFVVCVTVDAARAQPQACCLFNGHCVDLLPQTCISMGGEPQGTGLTCQSIAYTCRACCFLSTAQCRHLQPANCVALGGNLLPGGGYCDEILCLIRCCLQSGECIETTPEGCLQAGGSSPGWPSGGCEPEEACCFSDGVCADISPSCADGVGCTPNGGGLPCAETRGCCSPDGDCAELDWRCCYAQGGVPSPLGFHCGVVGACCLPNNECRDLDPECCALLGGCSHPGTPCAPAGCPPPRPAIVHAHGLPGETRLFSGYIDPRSDAGSGGTPAGITSCDVCFNVPVLGLPSPPAPEVAVGPQNFRLFQTGPAAAPIVTSVTRLDRLCYRVTWNRPVTLQQWTTLRVLFAFGCHGTPIQTLGNLGPGMVEPDRIDFGFLPGDVDQNRAVQPLDLLRFRRILNGTFIPSLGIAEDFVDTDRNGAIQPSDLLRFRQLIYGVAPSTMAWSGQTIGVQP